MHCKFSKSEPNLLVRWILYLYKSELPRIGTGACAQTNMNEQRIKEANKRATTLLKWNVRVRPLDQPADAPATCECDFGPFHLISSRLISHLNYSPLVAATRNSRPIIHTSTDTSPGITNAKLASVDHWPLLSALWVHHFIHDNRHNRLGALWARATLLTCQHYLEALLIDNCIKTKVLYNQPFIYIFCNYKLFIGVKTIMCLNALVSMKCFRILYKYFAFGDITHCSLKSHCRTQFIVTFIDTVLSFWL